MKHVRGKSLNTIKKYRTFERYLNELNSKISFSQLSEPLFQTFASWRQMASQLNVAAGGTKFAAGGPVNLFQGRNPLASNNASQALEERSLEGMMAKIDALIDAQDRRIDRLKVVNVATETDDVIKTINEIREQADV